MHEPPTAPHETTGRRQQLAYRIIRDATAEPQPEPAEPIEQVDSPSKPEKGPAAKSLGRRGGLKAGPARAKKLTADERSENGKKAAKAS